MIDDDKIMNFECTACKWRIIKTKQKKKPQLITFNTESEISFIDVASYFFSRFNTAKKRNSTFFAFLF